MKNVVVGLWLLVAILMGGCGDAASIPTASPTGERSPEEAAAYGGFHPGSRVEEGQIVMPLTFVDGSSAEAVAPGDLGVQHMSAAIYTAGGLEGVDRTIDFRYEDGSAFMDQGPLESYRGSEAAVEMWIPVPDMPAGCPNLVYRFGEWFVAVRTCQSELGPAERREWARSLEGRVTDDGFLVLSAIEPLQLEQAGGHDGPELILGMDRANWIELEPGECDPAMLPDEGDIRTMPDGTSVSFSRLGGADSKIENNWTATWCEDGLVWVQVIEAYRDFAEAAAETFRLRDVVLAP